MSLFNDAAIVNSRLGMGLHATYVWMYKHGHTLSQVKLFRAADVMECIETDTPLEEIGQLSLKRELISCGLLMGGDNNE